MSRVREKRHHRRALLYRANSVSEMAAAACSPAILAIASTMALTEVKYFT